jgi:hypothetical protein
MIATEEYSARPFTAGKDCGTEFRTGGRSSSPVNQSAPEAAKTVRSLAAHSALGPV